MLFYKNIFFLWRLKFWPLNRPPCLALVLDDRMVYGLTEHCLTALVPFGTDPNVKVCQFFTKAVVFLWELRFPPPFEMTTSIKVKND